MTRARARRPRVARALLVAGAVAALALHAGAQRAPARPRAAATRVDTTFAGLVARLSEPGGYFDTDNLISNESSYLHAMGRLRTLRASAPAGVYVGVGPDQNFSYIAAVRPRLAFVVDIRRDNLLEHLLFKSLFALARTRVEYLALLTGRAAPASADAWRGRTVEEIVAYVDGARPDARAAAAARAAVLARVRTFGVPLSDADLATIARFHNEFIAAGLDLRFTSHGRSPRPYYPTLRRLVLERDLAGRPASYLASEDDFRFLKAMQARDAVVPVVGDLGGGHALAELARLLEERGDRVAAIYTSNVEFYLLRQGSFDRFAESVRRLPRAPGALIVRSYFGFGGAPAHPQAVAGYASVQTVTRVDDFLAEQARGALETYEDVVTRRALDPRTK